MALLWMDGFDWIDSGVTGSTLDAVALKRYPARDTFTGTDARVIVGPHDLGTSLAFRWYTQYVQTPALAAGDTLFCGMRVASKRAIWRGGHDFLKVVNTTGGLQCSLRCYSDGSIHFVGGTSGTVTPLWKWGSGFQFYLELKVVIHDTTGSYEIRINGQTLVSQTNIDTKLTSDANIDRIRFGSFNTTGSAADEGCRITDLYVCDDSGSVNNTFLGPIRVLPLHPDADGDDEDWTLSSGTDSYALVNETEPVDGDSDYIEDSTTSNRTLFTYDDVPTGMGTDILGVQITTNPRVTDATTYDLINTVKSGGTLYPESAVTVSSQTFTGSGSHVMQLLESDPDTGIAWTSTGLNAAQFGVEVG